MECLQQDLKSTALARPRMAAVSLTPAAKVADQFGITRRTLSRWLIDPILAFPTAVEINKRLYFEQAELDEWKMRRIRRDHREAA